MGEGGEVIRKLALSTNVYPVIYPATINPSNYCWTLQSSSNLVDWVDQPSWCLTGIVDVNAQTNGAGFWRLKGSQ